MTVTELLAIFANPDVMQTLSTSDKLLAGLITTILGMGITFTALIALQFIIAGMNKLLNHSTAPQPQAQVTTPEASSLLKAKTEPYQDDNELVAVIASVIAMKMKTSVENIVIKNIEKLDDQSPAWNRAGIIEQMNSRL
jgi:sodium pump decarboxylase gamma subunit